MDSFSALSSFIAKYASSSYAMEANTLPVTESYEEVEQELANFERRGGGGNCYCVIG